MFDAYGRMIASVPGAVDDGSADGAIRTHLASGELVKLPIEDGRYMSEVQASGATYLQCGGQFALGNSDGSGTCLLILTQDSVTHNGGNRVSIPFYGTRFGVRYLLYTSSSYTEGLCVDIDGIRYEIRSKTEPFFSSSSPNCLEALWMCPDTFKDHKHIARIQIPGSMQNVNLTTYITGIVVERRPGNGDPIVNRRAITTGSPGQLTAAFARIAVTGALGLNTLNARWIRRIDYYNTDTAARIVQIQAGSTVIWEQILAAAGSAGSCASFIPGQDMVMNTGTDTTYDTYFEHKADAATKVNFHILGGN
jgi:hypothetical protein